MIKQPTNQIPTNLSSFIWHFIKQDKIRFILIGILSFGWAIDNMAWPYALKILISSITDYTGDKADIWFTIWPVLLFWLGLYIFIEVIFRSLGFLLASSIPRIEARIRLAMYEYVQNHSYSYFANQMSGSLANKINDLVSAIGHTITKIAWFYNASVLGIIISLIIFFKVNPIFALVMAIWIILHMALAIYHARPCSMAADVHAEQRSIMTGKIVDIFSNIINVKTFSREAEEYKNISNSQKYEEKLNNVAMSYVEKIRLYTGIIYILINGVIFVPLLVYAWQVNWIDIADLVMILTLSWNLSIMVWVSGNELPGIFKDIGICHQALRILQAEHKIVDLPGAKELKVFNNQIEFKNVNFGYDKKLVFENLNLKILPNTKVGLVGFSGSGKSTLVNLLMRFFDINSGEILIDNQNIKQVTRKSLRENISMIPQQPSLFHRSLRDNIKYGKMDASDEEMIAAAKLAHCHEFVEKIPQGYDILVGERGVKLSGGQRQRIAIARAMLKNSPILILDEATSALDSITEQLIQESLDKLMQNKTSLIIAHRLSTLQKVDRIIVFDNGKIIEDGTHSELIKNPHGHYAKMWRMQNSGFLP